MTTCGVDLGEWVMILPTETFSNLPQQKRQRVLDAALDEFAAHTFDNASIARIVDGAEIPRGSFYQYFDDLEDLYRYLFESLGDRKAKYLKEAMDEEAGTMENIRGMYVAAVDFASENPRMAALSVNFMREKRHFRSRIFHDFKELSIQFLRGILLQGQQKGEIDACVDVDMAAFVLHSLSISVMEHYLESSEKPERILDDQSGYLQLIDRVLYILENGMAPRQSPDETGQTPAARKGEGHV